MATAKPAVFALANAPVSNDVQVRAALANLARLSERPSPERAIMMIRAEPEVLSRPWIWLIAVMRQAADAGDHHLAAAGLYWACYWTSSLVPKVGNSIGDYMDLELDPISGKYKADILALGVSSASQLPGDFTIVGNETGQIQAGPLAVQAQRMLGL
jgi:hypothetical protein